MTADLPVGIVAEPTLVSTSLKIGAGALGLLTHKRALDKRSFQRIRLWHHQTPSRTM